MVSPKIIMVVRRDILFAKKHFDGFCPASDFDFESVILGNFEWMLRDQAETDQEFKQPVGYSIIYYPSQRQIFLYQRSKQDANYSERRLQGKWSCGIGGHIEKGDITDGNPIHDSALREIQEEVRISGKWQRRVLGYINDDSDDVGKVHFGILCLIEIECQDVQPIDAEISEGKLVPFQVFEEKCNSGEAVESWTKIALEAIRALK